MSATNIPQAIYTALFLKFVDYQAKRFIEHNGFGRWLYEYKAMEDAGLFEARQLRKQIINILCGRYTMGFICKQAIWYIYCNALDSTLDYIEGSTFDIRISETEIALDDDDTELEGLTFNDAIDTCRQMNATEGFTLFHVYDSDMDELIM